MRRETTAIILAFALSASLFALCVSASAQQTTKIPRVGFLSGRATPTTANPDPNAEAFRQGLRDFGYVEGKNILFEPRYSDANREVLAKHVAQLVQEKTDVLISGFFPAILAAKQATTTIPVVLVTAQDPVTTGLIDSLARPGGNITGLTLLTRELSGKRLELLKEIVPKLSRVGVFWRGTSAPGSAIGFKEYETAAHAMSVQLQSLELSQSNPDVEGAFRAAAKTGTNALILIRNPTVNRSLKRITDLAVKNRIPSMCERSEYVDAGCLLSYTSNDAESYRRAAYYVDKILKGVKPGDLPVEQPTKFELVINLKTAKQIVLNIPQSVLFRADRVIK